MATFPLICTFCKETFYRDAGHIKENKKLNQKPYCSIKCVGDSRNTKIKLICDNPRCDKTFERERKRMSRDSFCSRSCAVSVNNSKVPKNPGIRKICAVCEETFVSREKYCSTSCQAKGQIVPEGEIIRQIKDFYLKHERIPFKKEFSHPHAARDRFGSWNNAIKAAGLTPNPVMFANKHIAKDGHKCDSLAEKIIDDWLFRQKIDHKRTVPYPGNPALTADFVINEYWIEFFGLRGEHKRYDELLKEKQQLAKQYSLKFIEIHPEHLFPKNLLPTQLSLLLD